MSVLFVSSLFRSTMFLLTLLHLLSPVTAFAIWSLSGTDGWTSIVSAIPTSLTKRQSPSETDLDPNGVLSNLLQCNPCGGAECTYVNPNTIDSETFPVIVGVPITNCGGGNDTIDSQVGGTRLVQDSWSVTDNIGLDFGDLNIVSQGMWTATNGVTIDQMITIHVQPGQQGALVANVLFSRYMGPMQVGSSNNTLGNIISNQPLQVQSFTQEIVTCNSSFSANVSSNFVCSASRKLAPIDSAKVSVLFLALGMAWFALF